MAKIQVLSTALASQIAAGEVVERPASAIKELVENSIDAGATRCEVSIVAGGITLLRVQDDGSGMDEADARLCTERHATSKLKSIEDLNELSSFGFRGEALPSIASVSRFKLVTRARNSDVGTEVRIEGTEPVQVKPVGCPVGTTIEVRELFFNVPARRKFLRASGTEAGHVSEVLEGLALAHPGITFVFYRDERKVREWLRVTTRKERVEQVLDIRGLARCEGERGPLHVEAFLSPPEEARSGAQGLRLILNGRMIRDRALSVTVAQAYGSVLERGRYPRGVVYLELNPRLVDVNVHPQKLEVRFADPRALTDALYHILSSALGRAFGITTESRGWVSSRRPSAPAATNAPALVATGAPSLQRRDGEQPPGIPLDTHSEAPPRTDAAPAHGSWLGSGYLRAEGARAERTDSTPVDSEVRTQEGGPLASAPRGAAMLLAVRDSAPNAIVPANELKWSSLRFIAQLRKTYLLCEGPDALYVLDQHAAAERVTFTRLRHSFQARTVASQALLFPISVEVSSTEVDLVSKFESQIAEVGFDVKPIGERLLAVHAIPRLLERASPERLLRDLLAELSRTSGREFSNAVDLALATMACHGSLRAGDAVNEQEARALLKALDGADFAGHCPHGRPVLTTLGWNELERKVGRR